MLSRFFWKFIIPYQGITIKVLLMNNFFQVNVLFMLLWFKYTYSFFTSEDKILKNGKKDRTLKAFRFNLDTSAIPWPQLSANFMKLWSRYIYVTQKRGYFYLFSFGCNTWGSYFKGSIEVISGISQWNRNLGTRDINLLLLETCIHETNMKKLIIKIKTSNKCHGNANLSW